MLQVKLLQEQIKALDLDQHPVYLAEEKNYFQFYQLDFPNCRHFFGSFNCYSQNIAAHIYRPVQSRATVWLLHGFLDHCGCLKNVIRHLLKHDYAVACFDLPGHGLSGGARTEIDHFEAYSRILDYFFCHYSSSLPAPHHVIGHSTGCAVILDHLYTYPDPFKHKIFAAPLLRSSFWHISRLAHYLLRPLLIQKLPRWYRKNSSDVKYLKFIKKQDPLQDKIVSSQWAAALFDWHDKIVTYPGLDKQVTILQGDQDRTVDWRFNLNFLKKNMGRINIHMVKGARHLLFNEKAEYLCPTLDRMINILKSS